MKTLGYAAHSAESPLAPFHFERRELRPDDVAIEILYCGICHSDLHQARDDWGTANYPMIPGHEIVGRVIQVGTDVTRYQAGDNVAVGCIVDSCRECDQCQAGDEQYCREGMTVVFNSEDRVTGENTYGGFSKHIVVREAYVLSVPTALDLSRAAPILCAGITTYTPLKNYSVGPGSRIGVVGLGGLGHMAVKLAKGMGASVTIITHSEAKLDAAKALGADTVVLSSDEDAMAKTAGSLDLIINTVPVKHEINPYIPLLDVKGTLVMVGQVGPVVEPNMAPLIFAQRSVAGSLIGGIPDTQELLDFCAQHDIHPTCKMIRMDEVNEAFERLARGDIAHRFVIDMATLQDTTP